MHYKEYLANLAKLKQIDPLPVMNLNSVLRELERHKIRFPERGPWDTDPIYLEMCSKVRFNILNMFFLLFI